MTHTTLITPRGEWHTHIQECSRKGANQPDSTLERNDTESHAGMLMEETHAGMLLEERNTPP